MDNNISGKRLKMLLSEALVRRNSQSLCTTIDNNILKEKTIFNVVYVVLII